MRTAEIPQRDKLTRGAIWAVLAAACVTLAVSVWQAERAGEAVGDQWPSVTEPVRQRKLTLDELCVQERSAGRVCAPYGGG